MYNLSRKNLLGRGLMKMKKQFPEDYNFFPMTWMLPVEYHELKAYFDTTKKGKARTYIVKP
jgi:tubulin polyglutamylase TTLL6/13